MSSKTYFVVPATHIDLVWKKDRDEHEEILESTTLRLLDVLDHHPDFKYIIEQAAHFRTLAPRRPDLIERLRFYVEEGRVEFVGGLAASADTNGPSGESFVRNQLLGLEATRQLFGAELRSGYLIDTFGLHAQMPQILRQFGLDRMMANRFGGRLARDIFVVEGLDGSRLQVTGRDVNSPHVRWENVFFRHCRNYKQIKQLFDLAAEAETDGPLMVMPYNEYDGIAYTYIDKLVADMNAAGGARWKFATLSEYLDAIPGVEGDWPTYGSDLNPEFTGTFGQRTEIRTRNRRAETSLVEAEGWAALLGTNGWRDEVRDRWWELAFVQSHDVYTGSHPTSVFDATMEQISQAETTADKLLRACAERLVQPGGEGETTLLLLNGLPMERDAIVTTRLPEPSQGAVSAVVDENDTELPFEADGSELRFRAGFEGLSAKRVVVRTQSGAQATSPAPGWEAPADDAGDSIENEYVRVSFDAREGLCILPLAAGGGPVIRPAVTIQEDRGNFQIEDLRSAEMSARDYPVELEEIHQTPLRSRLVVSGQFPQVFSGGETPLAWRMELALYPGKSDVELALEVDWQGEGCRTRLKLDTGFDSSEAICEIPFGAVRRQPYHSRRTAKGEWPVQRWTAVEQDGRGVALVNCGTIGAEVIAGNIWSTLLRAPTSEYAGMVPDETSSQHGRHRFRFSVLPYQGSWTSGEVLRAAQDLNAPVTCHAVPSGPLKATGPLLRLSPPAAVLSAVKWPEDGAGDEIVVRIYQATGESTDAELIIQNARAAWHSDLSEARGESLDVADGRVRVTLAPFEIKTLRIGVTRS